MSRLGVVALCLLVGLFVGCKAEQPTHETNPLQKRGPLRGAGTLVAGAVPSMTASATAPPRTHIKSLAARLQTQTGPTLLHLWAAWCVNCRHEWPELVAISDAYRKRGLNLLSVATDPPEGEDQLIDYLSSNPPNFPVFWLEEAPEELKAIVGESWDGSLPASFVFRDGKMVWSKVGELSVEGVRVEFDELVKDSH